MSLKRVPGWKIYKDQMSQLLDGEALWEPAPLNYFKRVQLGDVGYIRNGCFNLLFSAGEELGKRRLGVEVPLTFQPLDVGTIVNRQPRLPGCLSTNTVRETGASVETSMCAVPMLEPGVNISFELSEKQGAALVTKFQTYREDIQRKQNFEEYTKRNYDSWVAFAREGGHGNDIKPVLVTGVDMTRHFAMMSYLDNGVRLKSEFKASVPGVISASASAWGTWHTEGLVHTNCGPQQCLPPSSTQTTGSTSSGVGYAEPVSEEYDQCVFVRYYTMRKRSFFIPRVIKAAAGPHDLGPGDRDNEEPPLAVQCDPGNESIMFGDDMDDNRMDTDSDTVFHNTPIDESDDFDLIADYIFQNSDANSVLIHNGDVAQLGKIAGSKATLSQLLENQPTIVVDRDGVGSIQHNADSSAEIQSNSLLEHESTGQTHMEVPVSRHFLNPQPRSTISYHHYHACPICCKNNYTFIVQRAYEPTQGVRMDPLNKQEITFRRGGRCGFPVRDGVSRHFQGLDDRDLRPFEGVEVADQATLRIEWPGYASWSTSFRTRDNAKNPVKLSWLAEHICKVIEKFIVDMEGVQCTEPVWGVGVGTILDVDTLALVSLRRVSYGSWMADIRIV